MPDTTIHDSRFLGVMARRMLPTTKHRPAIWENILGTVYAMNDDGEVRYFDYNHEAAREFAGVPDEDHAVVRDARTYRYNAELKRREGGRFWKETWTEPRLRQMVLWVKVEDA